MAVEIRLNHELSEMDKRAYKEAREMVQHFEQRNPGDPNKVKGAIAEAQSKIAIGSHPSPEEIYRYRVTEIAARYADVSDGRGGIDADSHKVARNKLVAALEGRHENGGLLRSQQLAIHTERGEYLSTPNQERVAGGRFGRNLIVGGAFAITAGIAAAAEPGATAGKVGDAMLNTALPGALEARRGDACGAFGKAAGAVASGAAMAMTAAPAAGLAVTATAASGPLAPVVGPVSAAAATGAVVAAGAATNEVVTPAAETACRATVQAAQYVRTKFGI